MHLMYSTLTFVLKNNVLNMIAILNITDFQCNFAFRESANENFLLKYVRLN